MEGIKAISGKKKPIRSYSSSLCKVVPCSLFSNALSALSDGDSSLSGSFSFPDIQYKHCICPKACVK